MKKLLILLLAMVVVPVTFVIAADLRRAQKQSIINDEWRQQDLKQVGDFGTTSRLVVTPLVNWDSVGPQYRTEPGVSYLIETDEHTLLFDVGFNQRHESPSPLEHNMATLGVSLSAIDAVFISHTHRDHVGGVKWEKERSFSLGIEQTDLSDKNIFTPVAMTYPGAEPKTIDIPSAILNGVASTGPIARQLFIGRIDEQALVINLENKGLVIVVGCGHQTLERLLKQVKASFSEPVYAIVGDLHYPVPEGRLKTIGIDAQRRLASGDGIFAPLAMKDVKAFETRLRPIQNIVLGGHDTSDAVFDLLEEGFDRQFKRAQVGESVTIE